MGVSYARGTPVQGSQDQNRVLTFRKNPQNLEGLPCFLQHDKPEEQGFNATPRKQNDKPEELPREQGGARARRRGSHPSPYTLYICMFTYIHM